MVSERRLERDVNSEQCRCGSTKATGLPLCSGCYHRLPDAYRKRLVYLMRGKRKILFRVIYTRCLAQLELLTPEAVLSVNEGRGNECNNSVPF